VTTIGIGVAILVGLIIVAALSRNLPADAPIPPETRARYDGLTANRTDEGYPELGESIIEVALYTSFDCAPCGTFHNQVTEGLTQRVRAGDISLVYVPLYATGNITNGQGATRAAICVAEQDPSAFWELQDAFFAWQTQFGNQAYTDPRIRGLIEQLDIDSGAFYGCLNSDRTNRVLETAQSQARALANYDGTPVVAINGIIPTNEDGAITEPEALFAVIDERIAGRQVQPDADAQATPEAERTPEAETTAEFTQSP
jgi:protein-disulfide isomerase